MFSHRCHGVFAVGCALVLTGLAGCALLSNMIVSPASLDFGQTETSKSFNVSFSGVALVWAVAVDPAAASWLSVTPEAGRGAATVTVTVNRSALPAASNTGNIIVMDQNQKQTVVQVSAAKAADGDDDGGGGGGGGNLEGKWYFLSVVYDEEMEAVKSLGYVGSMTFQGNVVEYAATETYSQEEKGLSEEDKEAICSEGYIVRGTYAADTASGEVDIAFTEEGWFQCCGGTCDEGTDVFDEPYLFYGIYEVLSDGKLALSMREETRPGSFQECAGEIQYLMIPESQLPSHPYWEGWTEYANLYAPDCKKDCGEECCTYCDSDGYCWDECETVCGKDGAAVQGKNPLDRVKGLMRR